MLRKIILLLVIALIVQPAFSQQTQREKKKEKGKKIPLSMFIPGVHQIKTKQYLKGGLLLGAFAGSISGTVIYNNKGNNGYDKYQNSNNVEDIIRFRNETEQSYKTRNLFIAGIFSVWLIHIIDLKFFNSPKSGITGGVGKNSIRVGFYHTF